MKAIILAGGLGTRLREAVSNTPKPMAPVNGQPFLKHQLDYWINQGINHFVLSTGYLHDHISNFFGYNYRNASIEYSVEDQPLGTGGGLLLAASKYALNEDFLLLNGDTYFEVDLSKLIEFSEEKNSSITFSLFKTTDKDRFMGVEINPEGKIAQLKAPRPEDESILANGGIYWIKNEHLLNPDTLKHFPLASKASLEDEIFPYLLSKNTSFFGLEFDEQFIDIGVPEDYRKCSEILPQ